MDNMSSPAHDKVAENELLTIQEVGDYLRVSRITVWRWCQQGIIPAFRIGRRWRIRRGALEQLISSHEAKQLLGN